MAVLPAVLGLLCLIAAGLALPEITNEKTLLRAGSEELFVNLALNEADQKLTAYSNKRVVEINLRDGSVLKDTPITPEQMITDTIPDGSGGRIAVFYHEGCIKRLSADGKVTGDFISCLKLSDGSLTSTPYGLARNSNGEVTYTDEFGDLIITVRKDGSEFTHFLPSIVTRPRGIDYDADTDTHYVTVSNGIVALEDKALISGVKDEYSRGFADGNLTDARYSHPIGVAVIRSGLLAVADYSNQRIRMLDLEEDSVSSLCTTGGECNFGHPMTIRGSQDLAKMFVGTDTGVFELEVSGLEFKPNLCHGLDASGEAEIQLEGQKMKVWCDIDSPDGPWITILKRFDGSVDFRRDRATYERGFGDINGEYWLGLDNIHLLTKNGNAKLRIDLEQYQPLPGQQKTAYALYDKFVVGDGSTDYTLEELSGYSGTAGDMETTGRANTGGPHAGQKFSTYDRDFDDQGNTNCAAEYNGGWWMRKCYTACLTCGPYKNPPQKFFSDAPIYFPFTMSKVGLLKMDMKVKLPK